MQRLLLSIAIGVAVMTAPACAADPKLTYKSVFSTKLPFGGKVAELRRNFRESNLVHESFQFLGGRNPIQNMSHEG